jgi:hypothetical protein
MGAVTLRPVSPAFISFTAAAELRIEHLWIDWVELESRKEGKGMDMGYLKTASLRRRSSPLTGWAA